MGAPVLGKFINARDGGPPVDQAQALGLRLDERMVLQMGGRTITARIACIDSH
tara:strand:+ start:3284 stop:3442 length:159 start_codon:yes stop_codon:yes gene_type:complete